MTLTLARPRSVPAESPRPFRPDLDEGPLRRLHQLVQEHQGAGASPMLAALNDVDCEYGGMDAALHATCRLLCDLLEQGWEISYARGDVWLAPPPSGARPGEFSTDRVKQRLRASLLVARNRQLRDPEVTRFLRRVERPRPHAGRLVSVLNLVDDGADLGERLRGVANLAESERETALAALIDPVIEPVSAIDASGHLRAISCPDTGLLLSEVWRYFRHTWSLEYRPTPGRTLQLLIRNAARPNRPVIGIAMLASAAARLQPRDHWIGWYLRESAAQGAEPWPDLEERVRSGAWDAGNVGRALATMLDQAIGAVRSDDLVPADQVVSPTDATIGLLRSLEATGRDARHTALGATSATKAAQQLRRIPTDPVTGAVDWKAASERPLFVMKRAETLRRLLEARRVFAEARLAEDPAAALTRLLGSGSGRSAVNVVLGEIRKRALAAEVMDVSVCGAVTPYNELLGGKLVALLLASADVRRLYAERYTGQVSEIASQVAGREVRRSVDLTLLTTTSLYGIGSSQYSRLDLPQSRHSGLEADVRWVEVGKSRGFGTFHLSEATLRALETVSRRKAQGIRRVNNVFGEGSNPRLRQIREGLDALEAGSSRSLADAILRHSMPRLIYACEVVPMAREVLLGIVGVSSPTVGASAPKIAAAWRRRWVVNRAARRDVLERIAHLGPSTVQKALTLAPVGQLMLPLASESATSATPDVRFVAMPADARRRVVRDLYKSIATCSDHHSEDTLRLLHVQTPVETFVQQHAAAGRVIFLTGNPGDGKTHLIRMIEGRLAARSVSLITDANDRPDDELIEAVERAIDERRGLVMAVNEGTLLDLLVRVRRRRPSARPSLNGAWPESAYRNLSIGLRHRAQEITDASRLTRSKRRSLAEVG